AAWKTSIISDRTTIDNIYKAPGSVSKSKKENKVTLKYSYAGFSISTDVLFREAETIKRTKFTTSRVFWQGTHMARLHSFDVTYLQKIVKGKVPKYTFSTTYPNYVYSWTSYKCPFDIYKKLVCYKPKLIATSGTLKKVL
ncbi:MAG: hypothetical protein FWG16_05430, partial [Micrococcales bacterium]|nr:hypothetical protein [Micrococcales bacterium]